MRWKKTLSNIGELLDAELFSIGDAKISLGALFIIGVIVVATYFLARSAQKGVAKAMTRRGVDHRETIRAAQRFVQVLIYICGCVAALQTIGIDLSTLFAAGAVFAVGLGFAMQNIAKNFISGVILLVEQTIKPDDVLELNGQMVRVMRMGIRSTIARNRDEEELIIPNSALVQETVVNYTMSDSVHLLKTKVGVRYNSDMNHVMQTIKAALNALAWRDSTIEPLVVMKEFGNSAVEFNIHVPTSDPWHSRQLMSDLNQTIWWSFKDAGITIAFPQIDVHFDSPIEQSLRAMGK